MKIRALVLLLVSVPLAAQTQPRTCKLVWNEYDLPATNHQQANRDPVSQKYTYWWGGGFKARCQGTKMVVTSDSAEYSELTQVMNLIGRARYQEDSTTIDASTLQYTQLNDQAFAEGNVRVTTRTGTTLSADQVRYYRPQGRGRPFASAFASGNSHLVLRDSAKVADSLTTKIDSDRLHMERDSLYYAGGSVVITRADIIARADSAETNTGKHTARLTGGAPRIDGRGSSKFSIEGRVLDVFGDVRKLERLFAKGKALALSDSLTLTADTLDVRTTGTVIDRLFAWGPGRARAKSPDRDVVANRIELVMPGQKLRDLIATGEARADSKPDSLVRSKERDWILGDTLIATFDQSVAVKPNEQPPLRVLTARGNAKSFHQVAQKDKADTLPTLNYVAGKRIVIQFLNGGVQNVRVQEQVTGINLVPARQDSSATSTKSKGRIPPKGGGA